MTIQAVPPIGTEVTIEGIDFGLERTNGNAFLLRDPITGFRGRQGFTPYYNRGTEVTTTGLAVEEQGNGIYRKTIFTFTGFSLAETFSSGVVTYGSQKLYDFPKGIIQVSPAIIALTATKSGAGISATFAGLVSLGTAAADTNATLTGTEADIIPSTVTPAATAGVATVNAVNTAVAILNGASTAKSLYYNELVNIADSTASATLILNGTVTIHWINGGSY